MLDSHDIQGLFDGEKLRSQSVRKQYKLIGLIVGLILLYIMVGYQSTQQQHRLSDLQKEVKDRKFEYLTISSQLVTITKMSHLSEQLQERGSQIKENKVPAIQVHP